MGIYYYANIGYGFKVDEHNDYEVFQKLEELREDETYSSYIHCENTVIEDCENYFVGIIIMDACGNYDNFKVMNPKEIVETSPEPDDIQHIQEISNQIFGKESKLEYMLFGEVG